MSEYQRRFEAAEAELDAAGVWPSNAVPPYIRFVRKLGFKPVLPHYMPLWRTFLGQSTFFILLMAFVSLSSLFGDSSKPVSDLLSNAVWIGLALGLSMTVYIYSVRRKYALSKWKELV